VPGLLLVAWWVPFTTALVVSLVAATVSYAVTWRFKRADVERENAFRVADLIAEAYRLAGGNEHTEKDAEEVELRMQEAIVRAQPLGDADLADRVGAADWYAFMLRIDINLVAPEPAEMTRAWRWARAALANVRAGLVPHLASPKLVGRRRAAERSFPTQEQLVDLGLIETGVDLRSIIYALDVWASER
jgi:hypothetical protein